MRIRRERACWPDWQFQPLFMRRYCRHVRGFFEQLLQQTFAKCDVLHVPVLSIGVPSAAETDVGGSAAMGEVLGRIVANTRPLNYLGLPSLAVPIGFTRHGLPQAMQLVARPFREDLLFRVGAAYEAAADRPRERPPL